MLTQFLSAVPGSALGKPVATLEDRHTEIVGALDFLLQDF
nr:CcdB family protein [Aquisalimonas sp.]